jgi:hypothetical protein
VAVLTLAFSSDPFLFPVQLEPALGLSSPSDRPVDIDKSVAETRPKKDNNCQNYLRGPHDISTKFRRVGKFWWLALAFTLSNSWIINIYSLARLVRR